MSCLGIRPLALDLCPVHWGRRRGNGKVEFEKCSVASQAREGAMHEKERGILLRIEIAQKSLLQERSRPLFNEGEVIHVGSLHTETVSYSGLE